MTKGRFKNPPLEGEPFEMWAVPTNGDPTGTRLVTTSLVTKVVFDLFTYRFRTISGLHYELVILEDTYDPN